MLTGPERARLRALQDRFLADPLVRKQVEGWGEDHPVAFEGAPTFREVRETLLPRWEGWFREFLEGTADG
jgi:hypothetical protein